MDLSIIIVSWNVRERLRDCLSRIFLSQKGFSFEVFVVDNNSADGTADMVRSDFPLVKLIANSDNLGFAKANNQAFRQSSGRYVLLLNPDTLPGEKTFVDLINWLDNNKQAAIAGIKLLNEKGEILRHVRRFPKLFDQLAIVLKLPHLFPFILNGYLRKEFDYGTAQKVDSVRGGFMAIRREALLKIVGEERMKRGELLDERYFLWFEEVDLCRAARENNSEVWYTPVAICVDFVGQSFSQLPRLSTQKYFRASMISYFKKWHPAYQVFVLRIAWFVGIFLTKAFRKFKSKGGRST
jgi:GT2 family glycosyltransferase